MKKLNKRILSALLALVLLLTNFPVVSFASDRFVITCEGNAVTKVEFYEHQRIAVSAEGRETEDCQWQILIPGTEQWVNIHGQTDRTIHLSKAVVGSLMAKGSAYVRCASITDGQETDHTPALQVTVKQGDPEPQAVAGPVATEAVPATVQTVPETAAPTAELTEPSVESTEIILEIPDETSAPTEEEAEVAVVMPTEETEAETTEIPSETTEIPVEATEEQSPVNTEAPVEKPEPIMFKTARQMQTAPVAEEEAEPTTDQSEFVTVEIKYVRYEYVSGQTELVANENPPFPSYKANLEYGSSLQGEKVEFPILVGYKAYFEEETQSSLSYTFGDTAFTENVTYTVKYKPDEVSYQVRYFFQNIYDDQYTEDAAKAVTRTGYTTATPDLSLVNRTFDGFTSMYYEPERIAADGSTVFEVYYERNYYLMEFDCAGGYGAATLYVRHGTYVTVPTPLYPGYSFDGWDLVMGEDPEAPVSSGDGSADTLPSEVPMYNSGYRALWTEDGTSYTVMYWIRNADNSTNYIISRQVTAESGESVSGRDDLAQYIATETPVNINRIQFIEADTDKVVRGDGSTVVNVYYRYKEYTLKFYYAMSSGTGENTKYYVIGGSTYHFGSLGPDTNDDIRLLDNEFVTNSNQRGEVTALPTLNEEGMKKGYTTGTVTSGNNTYYYISFTARYNDNISEMWPCSVFNSATRSTANTHDKWDSLQAVVSAWNGERYVKYTQDHQGGGDNQTIKGLYEKLDDNLLMTGQYADDTEVSYLCFWENGADIYWSVPELYRYNIYLEALPEDDLEGKLTITKKRVVDGKEEYVTYYLEETFDTCDNSEVAQQTQSSITGFKSVLYTSDTGRSYISQKNENGEMVWIEDESTNHNYATYEYVDLADDEFNHDLYADAFSINFYYDREIYRLNFRNHDGDLMDGEGAKVAYGRNLEIYGDYVRTERMNNGWRDEQTQEFFDPYPDTLEPGAYEFVGWYTSDRFLETEKITDWSTMHMPASDMKVYGKWAPKKHEVVFYDTYADLEADNRLESYTDKEGNPVQIGYPLEVEHGVCLPTQYYADPVKDGYVFHGWFYMDEGTQKRFSPDTMEVKSDLHLFAEWMALDQQNTQYTVTYVLESDPTVEVAPPTTGYISAGRTKTFTAKGNDEFYEEYRDKKLFPTVNSHSILMREDSSQNVYQFVYTEDDRVAYQVKYVDLGTGVELGRSEIKYSQDAIVTEKFLPIAGYVPQSYYIRKALVADGNINAEEDGIKAENWIVFYYTQSETETVFAVEYYLETDQDGQYTRHETIQGIALLKDNQGNTNVIDAGDEFEIKEYEGFSYSQYQIVTYGENGGENPGEMQEGATPSANASPYGLTFRLYYIRKPYDYMVEYRTYDTNGNELILETMSGSSAKYGTQVSHTAPTTYTKNDVQYQLAQGEPETKTITIRAVTEGTANPNKMEFYYLPRKVTVYYDVVYRDAALEQGCLVSQESELAGREEELRGSEAMAGSGFYFLGWYLDEAGKQPVEESWVTDGEYLTPGVLDNSEDAIHYYAHFAPYKLKISQTGMRSGDSAVYEVLSGNTKVARVMLTGKEDSVTIEQIPAGTYTVCEVTKDWTWTYTATQEQSVTLSETQKTAKVTFDFKDKYKGSCWLHGESRYGKEVGQ